MTYLGDKFALAFGGTVPKQPPQKHRRGSRRQRQKYAPVAAMPVTTPSANRDAPKIDTPVTTKTVAEYAKEFFQGGPIPSCFLVCRWIHGF